MICSDKTIHELCTNKDNEYRAEIKSLNRMTSANSGPMIEPYLSECVRKDEDGERVISYGRSSFGYDVTLAKEFKIFTNINSGIIDPKNPCETTMVSYEGDFVIIPPNSYILGRTVEYFRIPRDISVICVGKSTYARCGAIVNVTPIEAGFQGQVVIEISNSTNLPMKVYANEGIAQFIFFLGDQPCEVSYDDRGGKYQGQTGVALARM